MTNILLQKNSKYIEQKIILFPWKWTNIKYFYSNIL